MAGVKITDLDSASSVSEEDVLIIVDLSTNETKKVSISTAILSGRSGSSNSVLSLSSNSGSSNKIFFGEVDSGDYAPLNFDSDFHYNALTQTLFSPKLSGDGSSITNIVASSVDVTTTDSDIDFYLHFSKSSENSGVNFDSDFHYNALTQTLFSPKLSGDGSSITNILASNTEYTADSSGIWEGGVPTDTKTALDKLALPVKANKIANEPIQVGISSSSVLTTNTALESGILYPVGSASLQLTMPSNPVSGSRVIIRVEDYSDTELLRNGQKIQSLEENMTLDIPNYTYTFVYIDSTRGWSLL